jgi:hypothetical protein
LPEPSVGQAGRTSAGAAGEATGETAPDSRRLTGGEWLARRAAAGSALNLKSTGLTQNLGQL